MKFCGVEGTGAYLCNPHGRDASGSCLFRCHLPCCVTAITDQPTLHDYDHDDDGILVRSAPANHSSLSSLTYACLVFKFTTIWDGIAGEAGS